MIDEPLLELDDIQGHILLGFPSWHLRIVGISIQDTGEAALFIGRHLTKITDSGVAFDKKMERKMSFMLEGVRNIDEDILLAFSFSVNGLIKFGLSMEHLTDQAFINGMYASAASLNDKAGSKSDPKQWKFGGTAEKTPDMIIIAGSDDEASLEQFIEQLNIAKFGTIIFTEKGARLPGDKEHFGFRDAISQPAVRGRVTDIDFFATRYIAPADPRSELFSKPGQPLVWPGQFLFGYPIQVDDPKKPGPVADNQPAWTKNGSFLVIRRLNQDVALFRGAFEQLSADIKERYQEDIPPTTLEALFVGRWPDGTPLVASPKQADGDIAGNIFRDNFFSFQHDNDEILVQDAVIPAVAGDPMEQKCPFFSHIRKVNPRDDATEEGREKTLSKQILRRGINFGRAYEEDQAGERGLFFMAYQTSIREQFEFLQRNWANSQIKPNPLGNDFVIGQSGKKNNRRVAVLKVNGKEIEIDMSAEWVFTTGGGYFFTPGLSTIREMIGVKI
jgi:Dyp-type peroxidase family